MNELEDGKIYCHVFAVEGDYLFPKSFNAPPMKDDAFLHEGLLYYVVSRRFTQRGLLQLIVKLPE